MISMILILEIDLIDCCPCCTWLIGWCNHEALNSTAAQTLTDCAFCAIAFAMVSIQDITTIGAQLQVNWRNTAIGFRLASARRMHDAVIEILCCSPLISVIMAIVSTCVSALPTQDEIDCIIDGQHPLQVGIGQIAEVMAVIESCISKASLAFVGIEKRIETIPLNPFRLCTIATLCGPFPANYDFHCSSSLRLLALIRVCSLEGAGQIADYHELAANTVFGLMSPAIRWARSLMTSAVMIKRANIASAIDLAHSVYWCVALPASLVQRALEHATLNHLPLQQLNWFSTIDGALRKLAHWVRQDSFSPEQLEERISILCVRFTRDVLTPALKSEDGYGGLRNFRNCSYVTQSYCLIAELETALQGWQVNSSAVIALSASVANFAWAISSDCSATGLAADGNRYCCTRHLVVNRNLAIAYPAQLYCIDSSMAEVKTDEAGDIGTGTSATKKSIGKIEVAIAGKRVIITDDK